jgi:PTH2 family peptidyl-tRNA hydrolase
MKQIIVMRTDLRNAKGEKVRTGKLIAQGAHASLGAVLATGLDDPRVAEWLAGGFTKVCVRVDSEAELIAVWDKAISAGLITRFITDNGQTEFGGVPTSTCCAIGPDTNEALAPITGHLKLL